MNQNNFKKIFCLFLIVIFLLICIGLIIVGGIFLGLNVDHLDFTIHNRNFYYCLIGSILVGIFGFNFIFFVMILIIFVSYNKQDIKKYIFKIFKIKNNVNI